MVHAGIAVLLIGIAASSSFQTNREVSLRPGQSAEVNDYRITYERPTVDVSNERIAFGAILDVERDGRRFALLAPTRKYFRPAAFPIDRPISAFFAGESTSEVGLKAGLGRDLWTAVQPRIGPLLKRARGADQRFRAVARTRMRAAVAATSGDPGAARREAEFLQLAQAASIRQIAERYVEAPPPATFRVIVNPLVSWLWLGALISLAGALIAIWPAPGARRRPVSSLEGARLGRGLSRA